MEILSQTVRVVKKLLALCSGLTAQPHPFQRPRTLICNFRLHALKLAKRRATSNGSSSSDLPPGSGMEFNVMMTIRILIVLYTTTGARTR
jgi:hypothetical protein